MDLDLHWWVRLVHVTAAMLLVGGAVFALLLTWQPPGSPEAAPRDSGADPAMRATVTSSAAAAEWYEWLFWGAAPVSLATGIGNLGAFGVGLPDPATRWGLILTTKLALYAALLLFSVVRTFVVVRALEGSLRPSVATWRALYGGTTFLALAIAGYAEALAHG